MLFLSKSEVNETNWHFILYTFLHLLDSLELVNMSFKTLPFPPDRSYFTTRIIEICKDFRLMQSKLFSLLCIIIIAFGNCIWFMGNYTKLVNKIRLNMIGKMCFILLWAQL